MKKRSMKWIALLIATIMILGAFPMSGLAEEAAPTPAPTPVQTPEALNTPAPAPAPEGTVAPAATGTPAATETPFATETPVITGTPLPTETPVITGTPIPTETPLPTETPFDLSTLTGEALYAHLLTLEGDELKAALIGLTDEEYDAVMAIADKETIAQWDALFIANIPEELPPLPVPPPPPPDSNETNFTGGVGPLLGATSSAALMARKAGRVMSASTNSVVEAPVPEGPVPSPAQNAALITSKTAAVTGTEGEFEITLSAYTESNITTQPADIALVLDISSSMTQNPQTVNTYAAITGAPIAETVYYINRSNTYTQVTYSNGSWGYGSPRTVVEYRRGGTGGDSSGDGNSYPEYEFYTYSAEYIYTQVNSPSTSNGSTYYVRYSNGTYASVVRNSGNWYIGSTRVEQTTNSGNNDTDSNGNGRREYIFYSRSNYQAVPSAPAAAPAYYILLSSSSSYAQVAYSSGVWQYNNGTSLVTVEYAAGGEGTDGDGDGIPEYEFYYVSGQRTMTKLDALMEAATAFVGDINTKAPGSRIALVTYSGAANDLSGGFKPVSTDAERDVLTDLIADLTVGANATRTNLGMQTAQTAFTNDNPPAGARAKAVILFTDGIPNDGSSNTFIPLVANSTISLANAMKNPAGRKATVYTVGLFSGTERNEARVDPFMSYVSSNFGYLATPPQFPSNGGQPTPPASDGNPDTYYIYTNKLNELTLIFKAISSEMGTTIEDAQVKDIVARQFELTSESYDAIRADGGSITEVDGRQVITWAHDFTPVPVTGNVPDKSKPGYFEKTFVVKRRDGFIGGNNAYTNNGNSGVYVSGAITENFQMPQVNVQLLFGGFTVSNQDIYIGDSADIDAFFEELTYTINDITYDVDGINNAYADIFYTIKNGATTIGTYTILNGETEGDWAGEVGYEDGISGITEDTVFTVSVHITPAYEGDAPAVGQQVPQAGMTKTGSATVYVYKPVITMQNLAVYLTRTPDPNDAVDSVAWKHGDTDADPDVMDENPGLSYTFTQAFASYPTANTQVNISTVTRTDNSYVIAAAGRTVVNAPNQGNMTPHFTVYVVKPEVTCADKTMFLGDAQLSWATHFAAFPDADWPLTGLPAGLAPAGDAPELTYEINLPTPHTAGATTSGFNPVTGGEFDFNISVLSEGQDISSDTTIKNPVAGQTGHHFTIKVIAGQLTLTKTGGKAGESYIFTITGGGRTFREVIQGNGIKVIKGLPKGTYTVTEETNWSWRYNTVEYTWVGGDKTLGDTATDISIACIAENDDRTPYWLSGEHFAVNKFAAYGA